ncbi:MAG: FAD-containing monooxygenase EthA, partial [Pseudomonadota bacterium]|nr:FAD-containing monooxygenase EthA [Pseudomonadota bacterium]
FSSGYIQRSKSIMPKNAVAYPWRLNQEYVADRKLMQDDPIDDGLLAFRQHGANARSADEQLEAAE